jgi:ribonuclease D
VLPRLSGQADAILAALRRAAELPDSELPVVPRTRRPVVSGAQTVRAARLKEWRNRRAGNLKLDVAVVLPQRLIDRLAEAAPSDRDGLGRIEGLRRWRVEAFGDEMLAILAAAEESGSRTS